MVITLASAPQNLQGVPTRRRTRMDLRSVCYSLFLHLLILLVAHRSGAREMDGEKWSKMNQVQTHHSNLKNEDASDHPMVDSVPKEADVLRLHSMDFQEDDDRRSIHVEPKVHQHALTHSSSHMDHMDPSVTVFFLLDDLKLGKTMPIYFPDRGLSSSHFLPREEADAIPFSSKRLPNLLRLFSFSQGSPQATAMEDTLRQCEMKPIQGETKFCARSIASMLDFARKIFGLDNDIKFLSTKHPTSLTAALQKYTITEVPQEISAPKMVACHTMPYPYGVLYCHYQESESRVCRVSLVGEHGDKVEAIAVCHMDTSQWSQNHVSFRVLGIQPGTSPVCHFFPADNLVLVPSTSS